MLDPSRVALFIPPGLKDFKLNLFERIGKSIVAGGGRVVRHDYHELDALPDHIVPIVGCSPELKPLIDGWRARGRDRIQWDRGYARRVFATWLPRADSMESSYYRWHLNSFQMQTIRDVPNDRWAALKTAVQPWKPGGKHIVVALPSPTYMRSHGLEQWVDDTLRSLAVLTPRQIVVRDKESRRPLQRDLERAHCLVTHGSNAAVEAVILGCPVFVHPDSAASLVGLTDLSLIEKPIYPDRTAWLRSLAYSQFNERELVDGTLWRLLT
jgi:hypothetical protein